MFGTSIASHVAGAIGPFAGDKRGNIAVIFAIALVPIISFIGAAVDYSRANRARSTMQAALDATSLMLSKDLSSGAISSAQVSAKAQTYFTAMYTDTEANAISVTATYTANAGSAGSTVVVNGSGNVATDFMKVAGFPNIPFSANSSTAWGNARLRVAMALDNTGSMSSDGKIGALRTAATNLITQLSGLAQNNGDVYVSIIPFAKVVNVGSSNYTQNWIDWADWQNPPTQQSVITINLPSNWSAIGPGSSCPFTNSNSGFVCTTSPVNGSSNASTIPSSGTYNGYICPSEDANTHSFYNGCWNSVATGSQTNLCTGSSCSCSGGNNSCSCSGSGSNKVCKQNTYNHTWIANAQSTWTGCVTDRTQPYDTLATTPGAAGTLFPANQHYENSEAYCKTNNSPPLQPIVPLSYDWTALKNSIAGMQPTGGTNQAIGLAWAWQSLQTTDPLNAPALATNYSYNQAIILLSDGLNTEDRWPENGDGVTQFNGSIDARQKILCDNIKAQGVTIYTIQVNTSTPADPTSSVLQYCASGSQNFFLLYSASQVVTAFNSIGTALSQLRITN
jgi:Flp pilus assembly protein TadG